MTLPGFQPDWQALPGTQVMLVTGMHRSGTSMLARLISLMGVALGNHMVRPLPNDNETGFWEHEHLMKLHEEFLEHFASSHLSLTELPQDYLSLPPGVECQRKISGILRRDFAHVPCWGIKDPRIARLVPLWQETLSALGAEPVWVISVRHPAEVAASLVARNGISREKALLLWLDHNLKVELATRGQRRAFVYYPDVLADWKASLQRIARLTGFIFPRGYAEAEPEVLKFLRPELRHQQAEEIGDMPAWITDSFKALTRAASGDGTDAASAVLDNVRREFSGLTAPLQEEIAHLREINAGQAKDIEELQRHLDLLFHSLSWQVTRPIRAVKKGVKWAISSPKEQVS